MDRPNRIAAALAAQRGALFPWTPVALATGIGGYFALPGEPGSALWACLGAALILLALGLGRIGEDWRPLASFALVLLAGFGLAGARAHLVAAPVIWGHYYGPVEGRIAAIDRSQSDAVRLTLDRVRLADAAPSRTPLRLRISLHGAQDWLRPEIGMTVILTAHLSPPGGPVEPGGFDFQRQAWFDGLGAVGYTRTPALMLAPPPPGRALWVARLRQRLADRIRAVLPGEVGGFAAAVTTGDRSGIGRPTQEALRIANTAHLLAISGLHMGILTGYVFALLRLIPLLWPALALRIDPRRFAALGAMAAGGFYLALSGGNVATIRAYVMVAAVFLAVLIGRRAMSLRTVALAAAAILAVMPETLAEPGFQMSFAATVGLVGTYGAWRDAGALAGLRRRAAGWPWALRWALGVLCSSLVAGLATAPVAAAHFNRIADYGLIANLLSVPLMGLVVMPGAMIAAVLGPFGLDWIGLWIMAPAIRWLLAVAHAIAARPDAVTLVPSPPAAVLPLLSLGLLWMLLIRAGPRWRLAGLLPVLAGVFFWTMVERPAVLVAESGGLVGWSTPAGRALSKAKGDGFAAETWLQNDGDGAGQAAAAARAQAAWPDAGLRLVRAGGLRLAHLTGRGARDRLAEACSLAPLVISSVSLDGPHPAGCAVFDPARLTGAGALALFAGAPPAAAAQAAEAQVPAGAADASALPGVVAARDLSGRRLWNTPAARRGPAGG